MQGNFSFFWIFYWSATDCFKPPLELRKTRSICAFLIFFILYVNVDCFCHPQLTVRHEAESFSSPVSQW